MDDAAKAGFEGYDVANFRARMADIIRLSDSLALLMCASQLDLLLGSALFRRIANDRPGDNDGTALALFGDLAGDLPAKAKYAYLTGVIDEQLENAIEKFAAFCNRILRNPDAPLSAFELQVCYRLTPAAIRVEYDQLWESTKANGWSEGRATLLKLASVLERMIRDAVPEARGELLHNQKQPKQKS